MINSLKYHHYISFSSVGLVLLSGAFLMSFYSFADEITDEDISLLDNQLGNDKVIAVGEIGLDYYWDKEDVTRANQRKWFERQTVLAGEMGLPIVIHSRDAMAQTIEILKKHKNKIIISSFVGITQT